MKYKGIDIKIDIDETDGESPRNWSNLGYFITCDRDYWSPDRIDWLEKIVKDTGDEATSQADHIERITNAVNETGEKVLAVYPVVKYEHSGIVYRLGTQHGFDYSNNGFYIVTEKTAKELGTDPKDFEKMIKDEIETYNHYVNGEIYGFTLIDEITGEEIGSCWGYYGSDHEKSGLMETAKSEIDYYIKHSKAKAHAEYKAKQMTNTTLGELLGNSNETIKRNAMSILKILQKNK